MNDKELLEKITELKKVIKEKFVQNNLNEEILDVVYLGKVEWIDELNNKNMQEDLYIVKKEITNINKDGKEEKRQINNYYLGTECIGAYFSEEIPLVTNLKVGEKLNNINELLEKNKKENVKGKSLNELEKSQLEEKNKDKANKENENEEERELTKEETKKLGNIKQEIKTNIPVDDKKTLGQALDLDESEYQKIGIVYSDSIEEIGNSTRYSFVAIRNDGSSKAIDDKLELDELTGKNQMEESIKVDADETARKDNKTLSRYKIKGKDEYLSVENGQYGEVKAYYGKGKTIDGNMNVETQLETTSIGQTSIELRRLQSDRNGVYNTDEMANEANKHFEKDEEKIGLKDVDGNKETIEHLHLDSKYIQNIVDEFMEIPEVNDVFTRREIEDRTIRFFNNQKDIENIEELKNTLEAGIKYDAQMQIDRENRGRRTE